MTARQNSKNSMYRSVWQILLSNSLTYAAVLALVAAVVLLEALLLELDKAIDRQRLIRTGYAEDKRNKLIAMVRLAMKIKGGVQAYAEDNSLAVLYDSVDFEESILISGRAAYARSGCQIIYAEANAVLAQMGAGYGIVAQDLVDLLAAIIAFSGVISMPKAKRAELKTASGEIVKKMEKIDRLLQRKIDKQMLIYKNNPATAQFWSDYENSRKIYDPATSHTEIKALILNEETNQPMSNVKMIASSEHNSFFEISNDQGIADRQISPELTNLVFEIPGFQTVTTSVSPSPGEKEEVTIKMKPV
ncbi:MAG: hypothetical protein ABIT08_11665 [Bacteroidia bacterium]